MDRILNIDTVKNINKKVKICGWVHTIRSHGKIVFIDLRDRTGLVQIFFSAKQKELYLKACEIKPEYVISVVGKVSKRPDKMINPKIPTGKIEILAEELEIFSESETIPFPIDTDGYEINEEKRLKYRYLDIRRGRMKRNLVVRHNVIRYMRNFLQEKGFIEIETPILTKSTPEGARDFLVPSRFHRGEFYALPQSAQQYKQMLMVAGIENYFQISRCLRDEDPRGDRQAEHTQLDIEISFTSQREILELIEKLYISLVEKLFPEKKITKIPFPRITYKEAMSKYKTDKPDLRKKKTKDSLCNYGDNKKDPNELSFCFITDFPMFEKKKSSLANSRKEKWGAMHHPFTKPQTSNIEEIKKNPGKILAHQYDFVLNGYEIAGGSIRTTDLEVLEAVFEVLGHKREEVRAQFKNYFRAFNYGIPPHGGIAPGIDRFLAIVLNEPNIREVIAFPKTGDNKDLMMDAPSKVSEEQLEELGLKVVKERKKK